MINAFEFDPTTQNWLAPSISLSSDLLRKKHIEVYGHLIDITSGELEVLFHLRPPFFTEGFEEMLKQHGLSFDDIQSTDPQIAAQVNGCERGYDSFVKEKMIGKLEEIGIPESAQDVRGLQRGKGYWAFVSKFQVLPNKFGNPDDRLSELEEIIVNQTKNRFEIETEKALNYATFYSHPSATPMSAEAALHYFGHNAAYCLPPHKHWLLDKGYSIEAKPSRRKTFFSVKFNRHYLKENSINAEGIEVCDFLTMFNHKLRPIILTAFPALQPSTSEESSISSLNGL